MLKKKKLLIKRRSKYRLETMINVIAGETIRNRCAKLNTCGLRRKVRRMRLGK